MLKKKFWALIFFFCLLFNQVLADNEVRISKGSDQIPSNDLMENASSKKPLRAEDIKARQNGKNPLDLTKLNPKETDFWKNRIVKGHDASLDKLPINEGQLLEYMAPITSQSGTLRFNALSADGKTNQIFTVMLDKRLHTALLRKNLLRKLGYIIPAMKYVKKLKIKFKNKDSKEHFLKHVIPENTLGTPARWVKECKNAVEIDDCEAIKNEKLLELEIQDVVVMSPSEKDHFNVAMGVPLNNPISSRVLRALAAPYALLDVKESLEKLSWSEGRTDNGAYVLPHFTLANLNTTKEDIVWMLRRMKNIKYSDLKDIVKHAHYPTSLENYLAKKLASRYDSLMRLFSDEDKALTKSLMNKGTKADDVKDIIKDGRIVKEDWEGYASRFAHGLPDSPFAEIGYYALSKIQTNAIDNLVTTANTFLKGYDLGEARGEFAVDRFQEGLEHFVETGELSDLGIGTWTSPILNGSLIMSRDIVIGNQFGTDNLVQLADTFGYSVNFGGHLGIEAPLGEQWVGFARAEKAYIKTYSHLKPVKSLKATFEEDYKNIIVPFVKNQLEDDLADLETLAEDEEITDKDKKERLSEILKHIDKNLGVGESLLITDRIAPSIAGGVTIMFPATGSSFAISGGTNALIVKRTHIYRKSSGEIQVYIDKGKFGSAFISFAFRNLLPILEIRRRVTKGSYHMKAYTLNIDNDLKKNPDFFRNAHALEQFLETDSTELMDAIERPYEIHNSFRDKSSRLSFLMWRSRYLEGDSKMTVTTPEQHKNYFFQLKNVTQTGANFQSFITDIANYYIGEFINDLDTEDRDLLEGAAIANDRWKNPGQSFKGVSHTHYARFESRLKGDLKEGEDLSKLSISHPFISLTHQRQGWNISQERLLKEIDEIGRKYEGHEFFSKTKLNDLKKGLKLYDISIHTNLYEEAIEELKSLKNEDLKVLQGVYLKNRGQKDSNCNAKKGFNIDEPKGRFECGDLSKIITLNKKCKRLAKAKASNKHQGQCLLDLAKSLEQALDFSDFKNILGGEEGKENFFIHGQINGYREDSEILNDPIDANTIGNVGSRQWDGPINATHEKLGIQRGEGNGYWIRESLR